MHRFALSSEPIERDFGIHIEAYDQAALTPLDEAVADGLVTMTSDELRVRREVDATMSATAQGNSTHICAGPDVGLAFTRTI